VEALSVDSLWFGVPRLCVGEEDVPEAWHRAVNRRQKVLRCSEAGFDSTARIVEYGTGRTAVTFYLQSSEPTPTGHRVNAGFQCGVDCGTFYEFDLVRKEGRWTVVEKRHLYWL
jgi:hypothetical protein